MLGGGGYDAAISGWSRAGGQDARADAEVGSSSSRPDHRVFGSCHRCIFAVARGTSRSEGIRCVALHPLWGAAPEQKGCNADGSGALLLVLRLLWWCVALRCRPLLPLECCVAVGA